MTDYMKSWAEGLLSARSLVVKSRVTAVGEHDQHLGPRWEFARVTVSAEPAEAFEVVNKVAVSDDLKGLGFPEWAIYGVLDVLMVANIALLSSVRLTLEDVAWDAVDTSAVAFRQAGRDAGRKIMAALNA